VIPEGHLIKIKFSLKMAVARLLAKLGLSEDIFYVGSSEALPPPLTQDEEGVLLERLEAGDKNVKAILIERNLR